MTALAAALLAGGAAFALALALHDSRQRALARARMMGAELARRGRGVDLAALRASAEAALERALPAGLRQNLAKRLAESGAGAPTPGGLALRTLAAGLSGLAAGCLVGAGWLTAVFALCGAMLPWLKEHERDRARLKGLRRALPDALDLLVGCVEAGLAFDMALARVALRLGPGPLKQELERALSEMRLGAPRREALKRLAARAPLPELAGLVSCLVQADQMGAPLAPALRGQAAQMRALRSLRAQEQAARAPIKMLFPLMVFILPVVFMVLLGPVLLRLKAEGF